MRVAALALVLLAALPAVANAEGRIVAAAPNRYATPEVEIAAGERVGFTNQDLTRHDVVAEDSTAAGEPLFRSPLVDPGGEAPVAGAERLEAGTYRFLCSLHSSMRGTLRVTGERPPGPAEPGAGGGEDTTAPALELAIAGARLARVARGGLRVSVRPDEAAVVALRAMVRAAGRRVRLGSLTVRFDAAGRREALVAPSDRARRLLRRVRQARVEVRAVATDAAGNRTTETVRRRLRR